MTRQARFAGVFYVLTIITGLMGARLPNGPLADAANLAGTLCYVVVTVLLYLLFRGVNRPISLVAAMFSLVGCVFGILDALHRDATHIHYIVYFGVYCLLLGYLVFRSAFMPRFVGILVAVAGFGWLTFLFPPLAHRIMPAQMLTGLVGEGFLTVYLLIARFRPAEPHEHPAPAISRS